MDIGPGAPIVVPEQRTPHRGSNLLTRPAHTTQSRRDPPSTNRNSRKSSGTPLRHAQMFSTDGPVTRRDERIAARRR
jgi:hypothetical protein